MNIFKKHIRCVVYGGLDGIITTFAIVSGVIGANLSMGIILIMGFANLLADGFSMAAGAYLSSKAESEGRHKISKDAVMDSIITFSSFVCFGFLPLFPFILALFVETIPIILILSSVGMTFLTLMLLGIIKAKIIEVPVIRSVMEICLIGGAASLIAYGIGYGLSMLLSMI